MGPDAPVSLETINPLPRRAFLIAAIALGLLHTWLARNATNPDGLSYLDLASAFARGDWRAAVNGLWSPLYPALLGIVLAITRPGPVWEFTVVHLVNFVLFLAALASFDFLLREVARRLRDVSSTAGAGAGSPLPLWALWSLGYALFLWTTLDLITIAFVTPDLAVTAAALLAAALVLRIHREPARWTLYALLGAVLAVGYLAKAPMLPLSAVYLALVLLPGLHPAHRRGLILRMAVALAALAIVAAPFVAALSVKQGRLTVGESARLNYAWWVNGVPLIHWQGGPPGSGRPRHPTRQVLPHPRVYEFGSPIEATYPPWFDPTYWMEGLQPRIDLRAPLRNVLQSARTIYRIFLQEQAGVTAATALLLWAGWRKRRARDLAARGGLLLVPGIAALVLFSPIHLEPRFVGAFIALFWLGLFAAVTVPPLPEMRHLLRGAIAIMVAFLLLPVAIRTGNLFALAAQGNPHLRVARELRTMGLRRGDPVAFIGFTYAAHWARLGRFRVVAEIPEDGVPAFLNAGEAGQRSVLSAFAGTGARVVLIRTPAAPGQGWTRIRGTDYFVFRF